MLRRIEIVLRHHRHAARALFQHAMHEAGRDGRRRACGRRRRRRAGVLAPADAVADYGILYDVDVNGFYDNDDGAREDELRVLADS